MMDNVLNEIKQASLKYNISRVVLFGSRARGDNTEQSDYDIAVFANGITDSERLRFLQDIENINTLKKTDVVFITERNKKTKLYNNIIKEGKDIMNKFKIKLENYKNALSRLHEAIDESKKNPSLTVRDGVIQRFEFTTELAWKTVREYLISEGFTDINSPKRAMSEAYGSGIISNHDGWLGILSDRNLTSHIYDESDAEEIYERISGSYITLFDELKNKFETL